MKKRKTNHRKRDPLWQRGTRWLKWFLLVIGGWTLVSLAVNLAIRLPANERGPVDAIFVLGGSIRREIYVANLADRYPDIPILISQGSKDPCILLLFQREKARQSNVWLEKCANSTFGNFFFGVPILQDWGARKVRVITSPTHLPRAEWLAKIHLQSRGIAVEMDITPETGVPGNHESRRKTALDVARSLIWAVFGQVIRPPCWNVTALEDVDLKTWQEEGFECEYQGRIKIPDFH
ncbi:YdcF family protein [Pannus brasiliensis CCIBt3594]|uniref:YdcF family protein n=1 Tax=Pannus brasiliensis CCIBt3594 TaxID=1427578 RepID=A0AAW9QTZ7_9CHRO